jgi:catechol 2,3-dioxygenase-like lactoylglutathione lyase family enzyme
VPLALFAGVRVSDFKRALSWYGQLLGLGPSFFPHGTEAVWELARERLFYILEDRQNPGGGLVTVYLDDFDEFVAAAAERGIEPAERETYDNGVRKATYRDEDGNEVGFGGAPLSEG